MNRAAVEAAARVLCTSLRRDHLLGRTKQPCRACVSMTEQMFAAYTEAQAEAVAADA